MNWRKIRSEATFYIGFLAVFILFRTTAFAMYYIPSESMLPTLAVGDRIAVDKFAYGYSRHSLPFSFGPEISTPSGRVFAHMTKRGDVVVFKHPRTGETLIKRAIALPGDVVGLRRGRLYVNGALAERQAEESYEYLPHALRIPRHATRYKEAIPQGKTHEILEHSDTASGDEFGPMEIPANHIFVMGDNRDNSLDSRFKEQGVGLLHTKYLVGRADYLLFAINFEPKREGLKKHEGRPLTKLN